MYLCSQHHNAEYSAAVRLHAKWLEMDSRDLYEEKKITYHLRYSDLKSTLIIPNLMGFHYTAQVVLHSFFQKENKLPQDPAPVRYLFVDDEYL